MKYDLMGMILHNCRKKTFDAAVIRDGKELNEMESLHFLIMEYAKVANGGESPIVVVPDQFKSSAG